MKKNIDYRPDPHENMYFQIHKYFQKMCDSYSPFETTDINTYLKQGMDDFFHVFYALTAKNTIPFYKDLDVELPDWWKGPSLFIRDYKVCTPEDNTIGVTVTFSYMDEDDYCVLHLVPPSFFAEKLNKMNEN